MLLNHDLPGLLKANELCNRLGIDTISVGGTLAWAMEAYQRGVLDKDWLDGHHPKWGDAEEIIKLIKKIGLQDGRLGSLLGSGSAAASKVIGRDSESFAIHVKGLELGYHHPKVSRGMEITYATNPRGAVHTESPNMFQHENDSYQEWVKQIATTADQSTIPNAYVLCMFNCIPLGLPLMGRLVSAITGENWDEGSLTRAAERGWYLKRIFNLHCDTGCEADTLPVRIQEQIQAAGVDHDDFQQALELYHRYRQLDSKGIPSSEKLLELGLSDLDAGLKRG
jgi:aldehyde:ferredoxin oxidoreductase